MDSHVASVPCMLTNLHVSVVPFCSLLSERSATLATKVSWVASYTTFTSFWREGGFVSEVVWMESEERERERERDGIFNLLKCLNFGIG